ncbi:MAG: HEPN domain-containing protein [Actinobacteria bacterium]|nr:HEPN domain-containing protein [Actinomycetota bacterium]
MTIERARQSLAAARLLHDEGFYGQAVSQAYYAAFYAGRHALETLGEFPSKHSGVIQKFGQRLVVEGGIDPAQGRRLRILFDDRLKADCGEADVTSAEAEADIADAKAVVDAVDAWLAERSGG